MTLDANPHVGGHGITQGDKPFARVMWTDYRMYATMTGIGLHPRKSKTMGALKLPVDNNGKDYFWLFLRGLFEGDGSITVHPKTRTPCTILLVTGSSVFARWLRRQLYLRGVYKTSEFWSGRNCKDARKIRISAEHTHFMLRKMYVEWERQFGTLGHPEKKRRLYSKRVPIDSRPWDEKRRYTVPKIKAAFEICYQHFGRLPNCKEYARLREERIASFEDPHDFPGSGCVRKHFGPSWRSVLVWAARELEIGGDPALVDRRDLAAAALCLFANDLGGRIPNSREYRDMRRARRDCGQEIGDLPCYQSISAWFSSWSEAQEYASATRK
jgi:hypothetical protein